MRLSSGCARCYIRFRCPGTGRELLLLLLPQLLLLLVVLALQVLLLGAAGFEAQQPGEGAASRSVYLQEDSKVSKSVLCQQIASKISFG